MGEQGSKKGAFEVWARTWWLRGVCEVLSKQ